jgi:hypothetical protein
MVWRAPCVTSQPNRNVDELAQMKKFRFDEMFQTEDVGNFVKDFFGSHAARESFGVPHFTDFTLLTPAGRHKQPRMGDSGADQVGGSRAADNEDDEHVHF